MRHLKHNPALDGLRAFAVFAVLCQHMAAITGGYLGVDVFLVLSGFLITSLLLQEWDEYGTLSIKAFYIRRAYRLLPGFYFYVAIGALLVTLIKGASQQQDFWRGALSSLLYFNNYQRALINPNVGGTWFGHVWSLSLEEQFYVIWPVCLLLLSRSSRLRAQLPMILLGGVAAVVLWRELLIARGASDLRIYFGLDTRADALLVGCALGAFRHNGFRFSARRDADERAQPPAWVVGAGPIAFALLTVIALSAPELAHQITWLDRGGYTLVALLAGVVVLSVDASRSSVWSRLLGSRPLAFMGRISYAFYLWHYPVASLLPKFTARYGMLPALALGFAVSTMLAFLSTQFVEIPAQRRRPAWANVAAVRERPSGEHPRPSLVA